MKLLLPLLLLSSCAFFQPKKVYNSPTLVTGGEKEKSMTSDEIAQHLTREETMGGGIYNIKAMPLTRPYLEKHWNELKIARAIKKEDQTKAKAWHLDRFINQRTCIDFHYSIIRFDQMKELNQWKLMLEVDGDNIELEWMPESLSGQPFASEEQTATHPIKRWHNSGIACAPVELSIWRGFSLKVAAAYVPWPFSSSVELNWVFEAMNPEDEAAVEERKKKNYQKYRGW